MELVNPAAHLTYCTNIHPAQTWEETLAQLRLHVPEVKKRVCPDAEFGVGLRLSAAAVSELLQPAAMAFFEAWLEDEDLYVFTLNGFPYGPFHGTPVKDAVYRPDWSEPERSRYTRDLADVLCRVRPDADGSISTVPGCFGPRADPGRVEAIARNLVGAAVDLWRRHEGGGPRIVLALEPEPMCFLETLAQTVAFFEDHLFCASARSAFADASGLASSDSEDALRRHLGVCVDTCHTAVEFEEPGGIELLTRAQIEIAKLQVTTGLEVESLDTISIAGLRAFADDTYLHQVVVEGDPPERLLDLPELFERFERGDFAGRRCRIHFHIPVFEASVPPFRNTQSFLRPALQFAREHAVTRHLEVETYTWDVLPEQHRGRSVDDAIAAELQWVADFWSR